MQADKKDDEDKKPPPDLFDFAEGVRRRDEGIRLVTEHSKRWVQNTADKVALMIFDGWEGTSDHIRILLAQVDWPAPPAGKENCWGALMRLLATRKLIAHTGRSTRTLRASGHARRLPIYRSRL